jgi:hypothetical protein
MKATTNGGGVLQGSPGAVPELTGIVAGVPMMALPGAVAVVEVDLVAVALEVAEADTGVMMLVEEEVAPEAT